MTAARPKVLVMIPLNIARCRSGIETPKMVKPPENKAAPPIPATARPIISISELVATAQTTDPSPKITKAARYTALMLKKAYIFPKVGCNAAVVNKYALPYHPTSSRELKSLVICGIAVAKRSS